MRARDTVRGTMITLYQFGTAWGLPNISPFCIKVETYLRMAGLPYKACVGDPRKSPNRKLPAIDDDGQFVCDSSLILTHLKHKYGDKLDAKLTVEQRALGQLLRRTFEEGFYWSLVYAQW